MLKAVYGTAEHDSGAYLLEKIKENISVGAKSYILVPEQFSVYTERRIISVLGVSAQKNTEVLTFSRLSNLVLSELGPLRLKYIDGAGKQILASRTMQLIEKKLDYFRPNVHQSGFSGLMAELVSEFKRYGHTPEALLSAAEKIGDSDKTELGRKLTDMALFYKRYDELIAGSGADAEDNLALILPKIKECDFTKNSRLYVTEFRSFTPLETAALTELSKKTADTELILCCGDPEKPSDLFLKTAETYKNICAAAESEGIEIGRPEPIKFKKYLAPDIEHMIKNYFAPRPKKYGRPEHVHFMRPENTFEEIEAAADIIHRLCREKGYKQSDFLILARNAEEYSSIMPHVFEERGINVFLDKRRGLTENPYLLYISAVLDVLASGFSYERIMTIAKSGFCPGLKTDERDIFENYLLAACPGRSALNSADEWTYNPGRARYDMALVNRVKKIVLDPVTELKKSIKGRKTAADIAEALLKFTETQNNLETMQNICAEFSKKGMIYLAEEYRMAWNSVVSVLTEIRDITGDTKMTYEKFRELFISACGGVKIGVSPQTIDGTTFSRIDMFRSADTKIAIVLGMTEGVFPKSHGGEGLISDSERLLLREAGLPLAMTASERSIDENMLIYKALSAALDEIYFLSPAASGIETLNPSPVVTKLKNDIFDADFEPARRTIPETRAAALKLLKSKIAAGDEDDDTRTLMEIFKNSENLKKYIERLSAAENGYELLSKETVDKLYGRDIMLSASKLERFNECAFKYFMRYGLAALPRDIARFDPLNMGNVLHGTLERYFSKKRDYNKITKAECRKEISKIVSELAIDDSDIMYQSSAYYKYLITRMSGIASATAWETIKFFRESEFRPIGFEVRIGSDGTVPPVRVHTELGDASVEGFIDRVDGAVIDGKQYICVVDYKSSETGLKKPLAEAGVKFQPLVYAGALCRDGSREPAAMLYQQMNDPLIDGADDISEEEYDKKVHGKIASNGWIIDDQKTMNAFDKSGTFISPRSAIPVEEMKKRLENAEKKIAESAEGILSGEISVNPFTAYKYDPCLFCDYGGICGQENINTDDE